MDDYTEPVCCETPMFRRDEQEYYYYVCPQCGACTEETWTDEEPSDYGR